MAYGLALRFVLIFLTEHATHMFSMAHATGLLLLTILSGATITNFFSVNVPGASISAHWEDDCPLLGPFAG